MSSERHRLFDQIGLYLEYGMSRQLRPKTIVAYKQGLKLFEKWAREKENIKYCEDVSEAMIRRYIIDLQNRGKYTFNLKPDDELNNNPWNRPDYNAQISNVTINNYIRYMRAFFNWLEEEGIIEKTPMKRIRVLPSEREPKEYLEDEEFLRIISVLDRRSFSEFRDMIAMMIMLDSGTRIGETLSITEKQVDLKERTIFLPADKTKGRRARMVFFSKQTSTEIRKWIKIKNKVITSELLFPSMKTLDQISVSGFEDRFREYINRAGIKKRISPHTLRNNFAKRCLLSGMDIYTLSRILGHSSVTVTEDAYLDVKDLELKGKYQIYSPIKSIYRKHENKKDRNGKVNY